MRAVSRVARSLLLAVAVAAVIGLGLVAALQRRLLYFPSRASEADATVAATRAGLVPWRGGGGELLGWRTPGVGRATVVVLHGNGGDALGRLAWVRALAPRGLEVALLEYPGYGPRDGTPSLASLTAAAVEALDALAAEGREPWLVGESLGSGVAARAAAERPAVVRGLLLVTPFAELAAVARHHYGRAAGVLLRDRFAPARDLAAFRGPVVVLVAGQDAVVPAEEGRRLFAALPGPKRLLEQPRAGHNDLDLSPSAAWWDEALGFLGAGVSREP